MFPQASRLASGCSAWLDACWRTIVDAYERRPTGRRAPHRADAEQPRLAADDSAAVGEVLASLSAADRELLMLRHWEELKPAEIAVVLGRPAAVIRVRLHRARRRAEANFLEATREAPLLDRRGRLIEPAAAE